MAPPVCCMQRAIDRPAYRRYGGLIVALPFGVKVRLGLKYCREPSAMAGSQPVRGTGHSRRVAGAIAGQRDGAGVTTRRR